MTLPDRPAIVHAPADLLPPWLPAGRTRLLAGAVASTSARASSSPEEKTGCCVAYWMQRDVRVRDNWALCWAAHLASLRGVPLRVYYVLPPPPPPPSPPRDEEEDSPALPPDLAHLPLTERHGTFLLGGLELAHKELEALHVPLHVLRPASSAEVGQCVAAALAGRSAGGAAGSVAVCDFSPLRHHREWTELQLAPLLPEGAALWQVDAHNVVPAWTVGSRQVGARTLRPKIHKALPEYLLDDFPDLESLIDAGLQRGAVPRLPAFDRAAYQEFLRLDASVPAAGWAEPGTDAALRQLQRFCATGLARYADLRNDPNRPDVCSDLSPWINHGHVSFQRVALEVQKLHRRHATGAASYLEEGIVRRELSDNYLFYTPNDYDKLAGAAGWAQETLRVHSSDPREYTYGLREWEGAETHDDLWNAAQLQLVREGRMHGFLRMYWAKKILEWSPSPDLALRTAQHLNDRFALDGRDPNGFVGVGWSVMGIHDQGWGERPVFGKIRFMNYNGCKRKFSVPQFVARYPGAAENASRAGSPRGKSQADPWGSFKRKADGPASAKEKKNKKQK